MMRIRNRFFILLSLVAFASVGCTTLNQNQSTHISDLCNLLKNNPATFALQNPWETIDLNKGSIIWTYGDTIHLGEYTCKNNVLEVAFPRPDSPTTTAIYDGKRNILLWNEREFVRVNE